MEKIKSELLIFTLACALLVFSLNLFSTRQFEQIDPFYRALLEKAQKSFLAKDYEEAARQFEIACFGLTANKMLMAKACVYLGLAKYHLKNITESEQYLREAAELVGEEGFTSLEIDETAMLDLEKLLTFFDIRLCSQPTLAESPVQAKANQEKPQAKTENPGSPQKPLETEAKQEPITLDNIKEGDIVPLDLVETKPVAIRRIQPLYPPGAFRAGIEGTVIVNALISETGRVIKTEIIKRVKGAFGFDAAAQRAVQRWEFEPATIKGIKVKVWMPVAIEFKKQE